MKKSLSLILSLFLVIVLSVGVSAEGFLDMPNDWSRKALESAVENKIMQGHNGKIRPSDTITRAEMSTMIANMLRLEEQGKCENFKDLDAGKWYYEPVSKVVAADILKGVSLDKFDPEGRVTREQAFAAVARIYDISGTGRELNKFSDSKKVSAWAKKDLGGLVAAGYVNGSNGRLKPQDYISRAEMAQIFYNLNKKIISSSQSNLNIDGNILINAPDVTISNSKIKGDVLVAEGVGTGGLILKNVTIEGRVFIRSSAEIEIKDASQIKEIDSLTSKNPKLDISKESVVLDQVEKPEKDKLTVVKIKDFNNLIMYDKLDQNKLPKYYMILASDGKTYRREVDWQEANSASSKDQYYFNGYINLGQEFKENKLSIRIRVDIKERLEASYNDTYAKEVFELVNKERQKYGLKALKWSSDFKEATDKRAEEISRLFEHVRPDGSSIDSLFVGKDYRTYGENIAAGHTSPEKVMEGWMKSEGHRNNILHSEYDELAVSCYRDSAGRLNWVQIFIIK